MGCGAGRTLAAGSAAEVASRAPRRLLARRSELFENMFFSVSSAEAAAMDPQQRQMLERGYAALHERACAGRCWAATWRLRGRVGERVCKRAAALPAGGSVYAATGFSCSVTCGRFRSCSACKDRAPLTTLRARRRSWAITAACARCSTCECPLALSSGVNMILSSSAMRGNAIAGLTSVKGRSHTFDARADGYARGEAIVAVGLRAAWPPVRGRNQLAWERGSSGRTQRQPDRAQWAGAAGRAERRACRCSG